MTFTRWFFSFLTCTAMTTVFHCKADCPPPPTEPSYRWLDEFTVNVTWKKPRGLPDDSKVKYCLMKNGTDSPVCTQWRNFTENCLTEDKDSDRWTYNIWTVCNRSNESTRVAITIYPPQPRAEVVKDFICSIHPKKMNCSWIPVNRSLNLMLSYRACGSSEELRKSLKKCDKPYSSGERNGCNLQVDTTPDNICILVETEAGMSTFKPVFVVDPPELSITEEGDKLKLKLNWTPPEVGVDCWIYEVCYKHCNKPKKCQNVTGSTMEVPYDKRCLYEFNSSVRTTDYCIKLSSNVSVKIYGTNKPPDGTLTVVAIVIPIILSVCMILSCYCFRRHSAIICPIIPDPSAIFKEMMMNGNKELKTTTGSLYTPVPEPIEPCKITLVTENSVLQQNS